MLNEDEFTIFLNYLNTYYENIEENKLRYLSILDPYNHGNINFSDAVNLFGNVFKAFKI